MKHFIIPFICFVLISFAFNYHKEVEIMDEKMTIIDNYSIALDSDEIWGKLKLEIYLYPINEDVKMTIYNPHSEIVMEELIMVGNPIDEVLYLDAVKGTWLIDLSVNQSDLSYQLRLTEMYMTSVKEQSMLLHSVLIALTSLIATCIVIIIKQLFRVKKLKSLIYEKHDVDMFMETCGNLKASCFVRRIKNIYTMNIAVGHIYNGNYLKAKDILESIPVDRKGEVVIVKKWIKLYYINYISMLLELNETTDAENLINSKKDLLNSRTSHKNDKFFTPYLETILLMHKGDYTNAIDRFLALQSLAEREEDKAEINYSLSKAHYKLNNLIKAKEYLTRSKQFAKFKGINTKISNLENQIENTGINYEG